MYEVFRAIILHSFFVSIIKHINMKSLIVILSCLSLFFLTAGFTKNAGGRIAVAVSITVGGQEHAADVILSKVVMKVGGFLRGVYFGKIPGTV